MGVIHAYADGKTEDTGPLTKKRMETVDEESLAAALDFIDRQHKAPCVIRWPGVIKPGTVYNGMAAHEDFIPTFCAAGGDPDVVDKCLKGYQVGNKTFHVHLDGYNLIPFFKDELKESPRNEFLYWSDDGDLFAVRIKRWKMVFKENNEEEANIWRKEFTSLRGTRIFDLLADPFERLFLGLARALTGHAFIRSAKYGTKTPMPASKSNPVLIGRKYGNYIQLTSSDNYTDGKKVADILRSKFAAINQTTAPKRPNEGLGRTEEGMELARVEVSKLYETLESSVCELRGELLPLPVTKARTETDHFIMVHGPSTSGGRLTLRFLAEGFNWNATDVSLERLIGSDEKFDSGRKILRLRYSLSFDENGQVLWNSNQTVFNSEQVITEALLKFADSISDLFKGRQIS